MGTPNKHSVILSELEELLLAKMLQIHVKQFTLHWRKNICPTLIVKMIGSIFRSSLRKYGCIDGKHIRMECPKLSGTIYYNYKWFFSMILFAICDAYYCFSLFDLGQYGSNNDSRVLANPQMGQMFQDDLLHVPPGTKLQKDDLHN